MYDFTRFSATQNVVATVSPNFAMVLNMDTDEVYELDSVSQAFWEAIDAHQGDAKAIFAYLLERYDVSEDRLRADLDGLVATLVSQGLLNAE